MKKQYLPPVLPAPLKVEKLPKGVIWLSGEGAGSWFFISESHHENIFLIQRFSPEGVLECEGEFFIENELKFDLNNDYELTYPSHCSKVTVIQNHKHLSFIRMYNEIM